jgi:hypothetical protein
MVLEMTNDVQSSTYTSFETDQTPLHIRFTCHYLTPSLRVFRAKGITVRNYLEVNGGDSHIKVPEIPIHPLLVKLILVWLTDFKQFLLLT